MGISVIGKLATAATGRVRRIEGAPAARDEVQRHLFKAVGEFLADHRLGVTPSNYALAYAVVTGSDERIGRAVAEATFGDIRLSQAKADAILAGIGAAPPVVRGAARDDADADDSGAAMAMAAASAMALVRTIDQARDRFERYAGIVDTSRRDAQAYGDALAEEVVTLAPAAAPAPHAEPEAGAQAGSGPGTLAALLALTQSMIDKARAAEAQLRVAATEMDDLRADLAAARADAQTDALTGLPNRRAFEARFAERVEELAGDPVALALIDIDLFKAVNDRFGHDVGDRVIRLVARELADGCGTALVARYGGEEFAILFDGDAAAEAAALLDRTRAALNRRSFKVAGTEETLSGLSFSAGIVVIAPGEDGGRAMRQADAALYRAKKGGRNRVERG